MSLTSLCKPTLQDWRSPSYKQNVDIRKSSFRLDSRKQWQCPAYGNGKEIIVVGAGPGGLLTATLLAQRGFRVDIFEKRPAPDHDEKHFGSRSIVFGLLQRGQNSFKKAEIRLPDREKQASVWLNGLAQAKGTYTVKFKDGKVEESFSQLPASILFVERAALVEHMISEMQRLQPERVKLHYGQSLHDVDFQGQRAVFTDGDGHQSTRSFDFLVGCDGRRSAVRGFLEANDPDMYHEEHVSDRSYKGFHRLPPVGSIDMGDDTGIPLYFHLYGDTVRYNIAFWPTRYGTVTGQISCPREWFTEESNTEETYAELFRSKYPRFPKEWIPEASKQLVAARAAPNGASIWCSKLHGPNTVILGDAAHGVTPALGQGCNAALESAVTLSEVMDSCQGDIRKAPETFTKTRLADAQALFHMDRSSRSLAGFKGQRNFKYYAGKFHALLGKALSKILPFWFKGAAYPNMMRDVKPYSKVLQALQRDRWLFGSLMLSSICLLLFGTNSLLSKLTLPATGLAAA